VSPRGRDGRRGPFRPAPALGLVTAVALMELPSLRWRPGEPWSRFAARLREDRGVGLIELLIALLVLNIGIFATFAAFTSGAVALRHASHVSTATALADK